MSRTYEDIAQLLVSRIPRRNDIVAGVIVADLGLVNGTQQVLVQTGDATRPAVYLSPLAVRVPGNVFVTRAGPALDAPLVVMTTNYQVPPGGTGWGQIPWGTGPWGG